MQKELTFEKEGSSWYIVLPNWVGPKSALLMVGGAHKILDEISDQMGKKVVKILVNTTKEISPYTLRRSSYTLTGGAFYDYRGEGDVWLCPVTLFVFSKYPKMISFQPLFESNQKA